METATVTVRMEARSNRGLQKKPSYVLERKGSNRSSFESISNDSSLGSFLVSSSLASSDSITTMGSFASRDSVHPSPKKAAPSARCAAKQNGNNNGCDQMTTITSRMEQRLAALERKKQEQSSSGSLGALELIVTAEDEEEENQTSNTSVSTIDTEYEDGCENGSIPGINYEDGNDEEHVTPSNPALVKQDDADSKSSNENIAASFTKDYRQDLPRSPAQIKSSMESLSLEATRNKSFKNDNSFVLEPKESSMSIKSSFASADSSIGSLPLGSSLTSMGSFASRDSMRPNKKDEDHEKEKSSSSSNNNNIQPNAISARMEKRLQELERMKHQGSSRSLDLDMIAVDEEGEDASHSVDSLSTFDSVYDDSLEGEEEADVNEGNGAALEGSCNADDSCMEHPPNLVSSKGY